ncbi:DNA-binding protein [Brucella sp. BO3]|uniref:phage antirepressor KilAC domain-containing protein n=1 Tax=unclassified Brucella TaxID=2632610 RepID=UPI00086D335A|nr:MULTISPECIES: phage antirepressor KilAC domain-containing protein [unclassified Brucella]OEI82499.1 hypothetical protein BA060_12115 [Brucella sp. B13-0095]QMV26321.1 DNA-binding protein [Brucella sp. BO3]
MNDLINTTGGMPGTMTSLEIADVVNSRHDDVKRSIRRLAERGVIVQPPLADEQSTDAMGRTRVTQVYRVGERDSYVIVAQLSPEFTARLVDYWQEHKNQPRGITAADLLANPSQLLAIAQGYALQIEDMKREIVVMQQDVQVLDRIGGSDDLFGVRVTAKILDMAERKFTDWIQRIGWAYRQNGSKKLLCYADKHKAGYCKNVAESFTKPDGSEGVRETLKFYPRGIIRLAKRLNITLTEGDIHALVVSNREAA